MDKKNTEISKFLSLILRHQPQKIGVKLDRNGWVEIDELLDALSKHRKTLSREKLEQIVKDCPKQRFAISEDGLRIRANQGHSAEVELAYEPKEPPETLFHGTADRFLESIRKLGIIKGRRHHVHLSADEATAIAVGKRHGKPVVLRIRSGEMHRNGFVFFQSDNGVWLTDSVPTEFIEYKW